MERIDIKAGAMTYGQRIELGKILSDTELSEAVRFGRVFECLHGVTPAPTEYRKLFAYFKEIVEGLKYWAEAEATMLRYDMTAEERRAGLPEYQDKVGELGTVISIARSFGVEPDTVLGWQYGKVFGILLNDLEYSKYQRRYIKALGK